MRYCSFLLALICLQSCIGSRQPTRTVATPEARLAEAQLVAYNRRDIEAFLKPYSDTVKVYGSLSELQYQGIEAMRKTYTGWFNSLESLHCEVVNRIVVGNSVVDHEQCQFKRPGQPAKEMEAIAIYKIWDNKIQEVYFLKTK